MQHHAHKVIKHATSYPRRVIGILVVLLLLVALPVIVIQTQQQQSLQQQAQVFDYCASNPGVGGCGGDPLPPPGGNNTGSGGTNNGGSGTNTGGSTQPVYDYCASNPDKAACGGGTTNGGGTQNPGGGTNTGPIGNSPSNCPNGNCHYASGPNTTVVCDAGQCTECVNHSYSCDNVYVPGVSNNSQNNLGRPDGQVGGNTGAPTNGATCGEGAYCCSSQIGQCGYVDWQQDANGNWTSNLCNASGTTCTPFQDGAKPETGTNSPGGGTNNQEFVDVPAGSTANCPHGTGQDCQCTGSGSSQACYQNNGQGGYTCRGAGCAGLGNTDANTQNGGLGSSPNNPIPAAQQGTCGFSEQGCFVQQENGDIYFCRTNGCELYQSANNSGGTNNQQQFTNIPAGTGSCPVGNGQDCRCNANFDQCYQNNSQGGFFCYGSGCPANSDQNFQNVPAGTGDCPQGNGQECRCSGAGSTLQCFQNNGQGQFECVAGIACAKVTVEFKQTKPATQVGGSCLNNPGNFCQGTHGQEGTYGCDYNGNCYTIPPQNNVGIPAQQVGGNCPATEGGICTGANGTQHFCSKDHICAGIASAASAPGTDNTCVQSPSCGMNGDGIETSQIASGGTVTITGFGKSTGNNTNASATFTFFIAEGSADNIIAQSDPIAAVPDTTVGKFKAIWKTTIPETIKGNTNYHVWYQIQCGGSTQNQNGQNNQSNTSGNQPSSPENQNNGGFLNDLLSFFTRLFGGNTQETSQIQQVNPNPSNTTQNVATGSANGNQIQIKKFTPANIVGKNCSNAIFRFPSN